MSTIKEKSIVVSGDAAIDWFIISGTPTDEEIGSRRSVSQLCMQPGSVFLLSELTRGMVERNKLSNPENAWQVCAPTASEHLFQPVNHNIAHSFARCSPFPAKPTPAWRISESLGVQAAEASIAQPWQIISNDDPDTELVLINDSNLGFRNQPELWPKVLSNPSNHPWIIYRVAKPALQGNPLWNHLHDNFSERLIVVLPVEDLRQAEVQISRDLSWERTAQDAAWELAYNPKLNALLDCAHVIVTFQNVGAVLVSRPTEISELPDCQLFFDPRQSEGSWEQAFPGKMVGYHCCFLAGLAKQFMGDKPDLSSGIQSGLSSMRALHQNGYDTKTDGNALLPGLVFPTSRILTDLEKPAYRFAQAPIEFPTRLLLHKQAQNVQPPFEPGYWTILESRYTSKLDELARAVVLLGSETTLKDVPIGQFNNLLTVDRREIESFRAIRALIKEYCAATRVERPVSIAVFGPPGSGKSFGVKQVAKSLKLPDVKIEDITFNLSQMNSPEELAGALHQVRDKALKGIVPLVFWDEFDSALAGQKLGWLRYFLAPMQDGEFTEGQLHHPIGRAIFVFAGGTCATIEEFDGKRSQDFKDAKGPDFVSRLRGYVNILGANPPQKGERYDPFFLIRRAILLRSILGMTAPQLFSGGDGTGKLRIDRGVLEALLKVREYKHGARSVESIINMSALAGKTRFERSSLPAEAQIQLHVDSQNFFSHLQRTDFEEGRI
ncbi:MAG: ATP-binding protein, partial [Chloroflexota bacterium]